MQTRYLIVGAGSTGRYTAQLLAGAGHAVTLASRSISTSPDPKVRIATVDATDAKALVTLAEGTSAIFNCSMPRYDRWPQDFPPIADGIIEAARKTGAKLVTLSNVYGYGRARDRRGFRESSPMAPHTVKGRVRARMWEDALASGILTTEVRASDYLGFGAVSMFTLMVLPNLLSGEAVGYPGNLDSAHSWSFTFDAARTLVAAAENVKSWGRAWHVPSHTLSLRQLAGAISGKADVDLPSLSTMSPTVLAELGAENPILRELIEMRYLTDEPCVLDSTETQAELGMAATPLDIVLRDTLAVR